MVEIEDRDELLHEYTSEYPQILHRIYLHRNHHRWQHRDAHRLLWLQSSLIITCLRHLLLLSLQVNFDHGCANGAIRKRLHHFFHLLAHPWIRHGRCCSAASWRWWQEAWRQEWEWLLRAVLRIPCCRRLSGRHWSIGRHRHACSKAGRRHRHAHSGNHSSYNAWQQTIEHAIQTFWAYIIRLNFQHAHVRPTICRGNFSEKLRQRDYKLTFAKVQSQRQSRAVLPYATIADYDVAHCHVHAAKRMKS
mmetsp:Transcript_6580/g.10549  ORF Transcript_6580/g.10549 Transcript_6580/m.10549 type:complete len:248 (+) Transcript_6580:335-1078(+)